MPNGLPIVEQAFQLKGLSPMEQLVLLRLAYYADLLEVCRPSVNRLIEETGIARSTIYEALNSLEGRGLVTRQKGAKTTTYTLFVGSTTRTPDGSSRETRPAPGPEYGGLLVGTTSPTNLNLNTSYLRHDRPSGSHGQSQEPVEDSKPLASKPPRVTVTVGWGSHPDLKKRRKPQNKPVLARTDTRSRKETTVHPGQLEDDDQTPKTRRTRKAEAVAYLTDGDNLASTGKLPEEPKLPTGAPVSQWKATDLYRHLNRLAREKAPTLREQVPSGWARGDFAKWLKEGTSPEVIKATIDDFFKDPRNYSSIGQGTLTIWQKYRVYFIHNQEAAARRVEKSTTSIQDEIESTRTANAGVLERLQALMNDGAKK
jgi:hypothetical protein